MSLPSLSYVSRDIWKNLRKQALPHIGHYHDLYGSILRSSHVSFSLRLVFFPSSTTMTNSEAEDPYLGPFVLVLPSLLKTTFSHPTYLDQDTTLAPTFRPSDSERQAGTFQLDSRTVYNATLYSLLASNVTCPLLMTH